MLWYSIIIWLQWWLEDSWLLIWTFSKSHGHVGHVWFCDTSLCRFSNSDLFPTHAFAKPCLINVAGTRPEAEQASTNHQPQETTQPRNELCVVNSATRPPRCNFSRSKQVVAVAPGRSTWEAVGSCAAWRLRWFFRDSQDQALWISCHIQDLPRISRSWDQPLQELHGTGVAVTPLSRCPGSMLINMWTTRSSAWHRNVLQNAFYVTFRCFQNMLWALWPSTDERISSGQWRLSRATVDIRATWLRMVHEWWVRNEL